MEGVTDVTDPGTVAPGVPPTVLWGITGIVGIAVFRAGFIWGVEFKDKFPIPWVNGDAFGVVLKGI